MAERVTLPWTLLQAAQGSLFPGVPVAMALGIGLWFRLGFEPALPHYLAVAGLAALMAGLWLQGPELARPLGAAVLCLCAGFLAIGLRAHLVQAPMLDYPYYGAVQGRIIEIDRSQSDALRLTLDRVVLEDLSPARTPATVRVSLHGPPPETAHEPGQVVLVTARLAAPEGPTEPGGFDFRRMAFFDRLGAVGYTSAPVVLWMPAEAGEERINRLRTYLSRSIEAALPGDSGAFAAGAMTGDRSGISADVTEDLRESSLAHLLAISGMNMAFLTGFVFAITRYGLALIPPVALRVNSKKLAAVVAFGVALFYLLLSGANVATTRAFLMVSVMLGAVLLDRRALSFRSVALAAILLLAWQPESLVEPGFQLSFAATIALIAGFAPVDRWARARLPGWARPAVMLVATSALAGLATAPFAAATFNRFTDYGLLANVLTVPVFSLLMGAGAIAALLAPLGLAGPALWLMDLAARWILLVAHWIAGLEGAVTPIPAPGFWVVPLIALGGVGAVLAAGPLRWAAALPAALALGLWVASDRPEGLISSDGILVGVMGPEGRALSAAKGAGFAARSWLEDDGDLALLDEAAARPGFDGPSEARAFALGGVRGLVLSRKAGLEAVASACRMAGLVVVPASLGEVPDKSGPCLVVDRAFLDRSGAIALRPDATGLWVVPVRAAQRIWLGKKPVMSPVHLPARTGAGIEAMAPTE